MTVQGGGGYETFVRMSTSKNEFLKMSKSKVVRFSSKAPCLFTLKVELAPEWIQPVIWRRIQVDGRISLAKLHHFIQAAFGWSDSHLHEYRIGDQRYGEPDPEFSDDHVEEDRKAFLNRLLGEGDQITYTYDFGDNWEHLITIESIEFGEDCDLSGGAFVIGGARACPPEDVGGVPGYQDFLETLLTEPNSEEAAHLLNWLGGDFDAEWFDQRLANAAILRMMYNGWGGK
jgi:hypothetical protein